MMDSKSLPQIQSSGGGSGLVPPSLPLLPPPITTTAAAVKNNGIEITPVIPVPPTTTTAPATSTPAKPTKSAPPARPFPPSLVQSASANDLSPAKTRPKATSVASGSTAPFRIGTAQEIVLILPFPDWLVPPNEQIGSPARLRSSSPRAASSPTHSFAASGSPHSITAGSPRGPDSAHSSGGAVSMLIPIPIPFCGSPPITLAPAQPMSAEQAAALYWQESEIGRNPSAMNNLGCGFLFGTGTATGGSIIPRDPTKGVQLLTAAAKAGCVNAQINLAVCQIAGLGVPRNARAGFVALKSFTASEPAAVLNTGLCHFSDTWGAVSSDDSQTVCKRDEQLAVSLVFASGANSFPPALGLMAACYERGYVPTVAVTGAGSVEAKSVASASTAGKALEYQLRSANGGFTPAQLTLGAKYSAGFQPPQTAGASAGTPTATRGRAGSGSTLVVPNGMNLVTGAVTKDEREAFSWYERAATQALSSGGGGFHQYEACYQVGLAYALGRGVGYDPRKAVEYYELAAGGGGAITIATITAPAVAAPSNGSAGGSAVGFISSHAFAELSLGIGYAEGLLGLEKNTKLAVEFFRRAATTAGDVTTSGVAGVVALCKLGAAHIAGEVAGCGAPGNEENLARAAECYRRAAEFGSSLAQYQYAMLLLHNQTQSVAGADAKANARAGVEWLRRSCTNPHGSNSDARCELGVCFMTGTGVDSIDTKSGVECYMAAATAGNAEAQCSLGVCYAEGVSGVLNRDSRKAVEWWLAAAGSVGSSSAAAAASSGGGGSGSGKPSTSQSARAAYNLGLAFANGDGVDSGPDWSSALLWLERSARAGYGMAQLCLGDVYFKGLNGTAIDLSAAQNWFEKAHALGVVEATCRLAAVYDRKAIQLYTQATASTPAPGSGPSAAAAISDAAYQLGVSYALNIRGITASDENRSLADQWLTRASATGSVEAKRFLSTLPASEAERSAFIKTDSTCEPPRSGCVCGSCTDLMRHFVCAFR